jgi:hypothetical protein
MKSLAIVIVCLLVVLGMALTSTGAESEKDYDTHIAALKSKLPSGEFTIVKESPFVVIGDDDSEAIKAFAAGTVRWAVRMLKKDYFKKDPPEIIDIWLFKDKQSYEANVKKLFGTSPHTPFGYYSPAHKALIMNISTGGGTLVHEIVHPFMRVNFPDCPPWFNEGMGSLYEQCSERDGSIWGLTNWRLAGLQETIRKKSVPSFRELTAMDDEDFYQKDKGTNYAQARYLLYYLQEKGLLVKFYREFTANAKNDPTGYKTLQKVLGEKDMDAFKKRWEAYVLTLKFP